MKAGVLGGLALWMLCGSTWADPDLRQWHGSSGTLHRFDWKS